jgi:bacteriophage lambda ninG protein|nr:MAG TPA: NinG recombination protein [Caudoviricetes sp.]DAS49640.1 MAG TPA: NinG recombination protein [Caudoviricetes sp.]
MMNKYYFNRKKKDAHSEEKTHRKKSTRSKPNLTKKLDKVFSAYIRLRDTMPSGFFTCISCGQIKPFEQGDCGHYVNRQHMSLRFSEMNCNMQCRKCNRFDEGNIMGYRQGLVKKYGEQRVVMLEAHKRETRHWSDFELEAMIKHYTEEVKRLSSLKGIRVNI